jgi:hypothetical protein
MGTLYDEDVVAWAEQQAALLRADSWVYTIREQRAAIHLGIVKSPGLKSVLADPAWVKQTYHLAKVKAYEDTYDRILPDELPWTMDQIPSTDFMPDTGKRYSPP